MITPTDELVAWAWLKSAPLLDGIGCGTSLPQTNGKSDVSRWGSNVFAQVTLSPLSPPPHPEFPSHTPRIVVSCWAAPKQWSDAADLAQQIRLETRRRWNGSRVVTLPLSGYDTAKVLAVSYLAEPARITGDPNNFARFDIPLQFEWVESHWAFLN